MIGDAKGYCLLKSLEHCFIGYDEELDPAGFRRALVDVRSMDDVYRHFLCDEYGGVLLPCGLSTGEKMIQSMLRLTRKGGYNELLRKMVIVTSLHKGEFNDDFLFAKQ